MDRPDDVFYGAERMKALASAFELPAEDDARRRTPGLRLHYPRDQIGEARLQPLERQTAHLSLMVERRG
jgi:hypothetical protein